MKLFPYFCLVNLLNFFENLYERYNGLTTKTS